MKMNLGCGNTRLDGYVNLDGAAGDTIYPLDATWVDEIRASHVLEHFGHREVPAVLADWVCALKHGGTLKIAVPDFEVINRGYLSGQKWPVESFVMGGQIDDRDYHRSMFDRSSLTDAMRAAGLRAIQRWESDASDCSSYPISLNLQGIKRRPLTSEDIANLNPAAVMSVPRLGFMDNFFCVFQALQPLKIPLRKWSGAFWGQCLERIMDQCIAEGHEWILTVDYDTVFTKDAITDLLELARDLDADAIAPIQAHRTKPTPLMTIRGENGELMNSAPVEMFFPEATQVSTAHFGLTLLRVSALQDIPHPWFQGIPDPDGKWGAGRTDDDIHLWQRWREHGKTLMLANHVVIGHGEFMIRWPGRDFQAIYQHPNEFYESGAPEEVWR